jgi:DNA-binding FrmR family transcriptional regulator
MVHDRRPGVAELSLAEQAKTRLRRIEGQVRGIERMLDRVSEAPEQRQELARRVNELLAAGKRPAQVARELAIARQRVDDIAGGREPVCGDEPCDSLLTQVLAVHAAVEQVGLIIMELHLRRCLLGDLEVSEERMRDLRESLKLWSRLS